MPLVSNGYSAIREHQLECDSPIDMKDFEVVGSSSNAIDLEILESIHIHHEKPSLNNKQAAAPRSEHRSWGTETAVQLNSPLCLICSAYLITHFIYFICSNMDKI